MIFACPFPTGELPKEVTPQSTATSDLAKDAQIARFKERVRALEEQVRSLQEENELLYGKLSL